MVLTIIQINLTSQLTVICENYSAYKAFNKKTTMNSSIHSKNNNTIQDHTST